MYQDWAVTQIPARKSIRPSAGVNLIKVQHDLVPVLLPPCGSSLGQPQRVWSVPSGQ